MSYRRSTQSYGRRGGASNIKIRLLMAAGMALFALFSYYSKKTVNPVTGQDQFLSLTQEQEIALGLQAAPEMAAQHGGLFQDQELQDYLDEIGEELVRESLAADTGWNWEFHLLADPQTVNAFALPGGQVFITAALYERLETEGQLAGVIGHEIGHVLARHSAQRMAKAELTQGLIGSVSVGGGYSSAQMASLVGNMINMKYGRGDELESDELGVIIMAQAGYDPHSLKGVMEILASASGGSQPEFMSTHPDPGNRVENINDTIEQEFPDGLPDGLIP